METAFRIALRLIAIALTALASLAAAQRVPASAPAPRWIPPPHVVGRLTAAELGLVINDADPYSVEVGAYYAERRGLRPAQVLHVNLPTRPVLSDSEFLSLREAIAARFGEGIQALALAWASPYAVSCNSITGALALGVDESLCRASCAPSRPSRYFDSPSARPWSDLGLRPSMLMAAGSVEQARALIDRGVAADGSLVRRGRPTVGAWFLTTSDKARGVRAAVYPPPGRLAAAGVDVHVAPAAELAGARHVLLAMTGSVHLDLPPAVDFVAGALADHLTSLGGQLEGRHGQSTALEWIAAGATASYGTVSEPCNHLQKFPHPQLLLLEYLQGATAIEAYWKSVAWPQQGLFVGEPLAAPFARR